MVVRFQLALALALTGCEHLAFDPGGDAGGGGDGGADAATDGAGACTWGPWSAATELAVVNSLATDYDPTLSSDGLTLDLCTTPACDAGLIG